MSLTNIETGLLGSGSVVALGIFYKIYTALNHKRCKSTCNGKTITASFDVSEITPTVHPDTVIPVGFPPTIDTVVSPRADVLSPRMADIQTTPSPRLNPSIPSYQPSPLSRTSTVDKNTLPQ